MPDGELNGELRLYNVSQLPEGSRTQQHVIKVLPEDFTSYQIEAADADIPVTYSISARNYAENPVDSYSPVTNIYVPATQQCKYDTIVCDSRT